MCLTAFQCVRRIVDVKDYGFFRRSRLDMGNVGLLSNTKGIWVAVGGGGYGANAGDFVGCAETKADLGALFGRIKTGPNGCDEALLGPNAGLVRGAIQSFIGTLPKATIDGNGIPALSMVLYVDKDTPQAWILTSLTAVLRATDTVLGLAGAGHTEHIFGISRTLANAIVSGVNITECALLKTKSKLGGMGEVKDLLSCARKFILSSQGLEEETWDGSAGPAHLRL